MGGGSADPGAHTSWSSVDVDSSSSPIRSYGYPGSIEPSKVQLEKVHNANDTAIISDIDCIMRRHTDKLLQAIDGLGARLSQLESRTLQLELSVDDLKVSVGNIHGSTDGNIRQTENILLEVQSCVRDLKYKQEVMNAQVQPKKLTLSELMETQGTQSFAQTNPAQQTTSAPQQLNQQFSLASLQPFPISISPCSPPPPQQSIPHSIQLPSQYPPTPTPAFPQLDTYFPPASQTQEAPSQQFLLPPALQQQTQTLPLPSGMVEHHQFFQLAPPLLYPPHQQPVAADNSPLQPPVAHHPEEARINSETYPPSFQQFYSLYDSPSEPYSYSGSSSRYGNDLAGTYQPHSFGTGGNNNYPQIPTASAVSSGMGPAGIENTVPIDDVVDRVARMGFSREGVRETVLKMTENGQAVDLNVVLDKLVNDGEVQHPPRAWFGP